MVFDLIGMTTRHSLLSGEGCRVYSVWLHNANYPEFGVDSVQGVHSIV